MRLQRLGRLAPDLFAFDRRHRLSWRLAVRTLLALALPLVAAHLLSEPLLVYVALGGFLVSIGDGVEDGDRGQVARLCIGALAGGLAVASGALVSTSLPLALLATLAWCFCAALLGVWGAALASMGLPIAWAIVEVGLPSHQAEPARALLLGALWMAGGALVVVLTPLVRIGGANTALREQVGACYRALADYIAAAGPAHPPIHRVVSPETEVRAAIAEARRLARNRRAGCPPRERALIETVDRLFAEAALRRTDGTVPEATRAALAHEARALAAAVEGRHLADPTPVEAAPGDAAHRLVDGLDEARRLLDGRLAPPPLEESREMPGEAAHDGIGARLAAALQPQSVAARHALRYALVTAAAVAVYWYLPTPFGYWVPLTVTCVLKPYAGTTVSRTLHRIAGTVLGVTLGGGLMHVLPTAAYPAVAAAAFFGLMLVVQFNYSLAIFFLSLGLVPFEHVLTPDLGPEVGPWRLGATAIGAVLAVVGGHLLWPSFERRELPSLLQHALRSVALYARTAIDGAPIDGPRWQAGLDVTNFHTTAQRALSEVGLDPDNADAIVLAADALQQAMLAIHVMANSPRLQVDAATARGLALLDDLATGAADADATARGLHALAAAQPDVRFASLVPPLESLAACAARWADGAKPG